MNHDECRVTRAPIEFDVAVGSHGQRASIRLEGWVGMEPADVFAHVVKLVEKLGIESTPPNESPLTAGSDCPPLPVNLPQKRRKAPPPVHKFDADEARARAAEAVGDG